MAIDIHYEQTWYAKQLHEQALITAALSRADVQQALRACPDADGLSASVNDGQVRLSLFVSLGRDPAIAAIADLCDGRDYVLEHKQPLLDAEGVRVEAQISGRCPLDEDERELLRRIGKLKAETTTREYLACAA